MHIVVGTHEDLLVLGRPRSILVLGSVHAGLVAPVLVFYPAGRRRIPIDGRPPVSMGRGTPWAICSTSRAGPRGNRTGRLEIGIHGGICRQKRRMEDRRGVRGGTRRDIRRRWRSAGPCDSCPFTRPSLSGISSRNPKLTGFFKPRSSRMAPMTNRAWCDASLGFSYFQQGIA